MKRWMTPLATLAGVSVMLAGAQGQTASTAAQTETPKAAGKQVKPKPDAKAASKDQTKKATGDKAGDKSDSSDEDEPAPLYNSVELAYTTWKASRYANAMNQNGTVSGGIGLSRLAIVTPFDHDLFYALEIKGTPGLDFIAHFEAEVGAKSTLTANARHFSFFDPSVGTRDPSTRSGYDATFEHQLVPNFGGFATYKFDQYQHNFPPPGPQTDYVNRTFAIGGQTQLGDHTFGATYTETRFSDLNETQPITVTNTGEFRYVGQWGPNLTTVGTATVSLIQQRSRPESWVHTYAVSGIYDVAEGSSLGGHINESLIDLNWVQNAYVRRRVDSGLNYEGRLGRLGFGFGFSHREEERVRADHSYVDVPAWNTFDVKLNGRVAKLYRVSVKGSLESLTNAPIFQTDDPTLLYWSKKAQVQAKVSGGNETNAGYASFTYKYRENIDRQYALNWYNMAGGASHVFSPKLLGYAEVALDQYNTFGSSSVAPSLETYFPASETFSVGLDFTRSPRENYSLVLTSFYTEDQWGQQVALSYHLDLGKERFFQFTYSPWLQRDRLYDVDTFTAPVLVVKLGVRF